MMTAMLKADATSAGSAMAQVIITKPTDIELVDWMSRLRNWFDHHHIEPVGFVYDGGSSDQTYSVTFADQGQVDLFAATFNQSTFDNNHRRTTGRDALRVG